MRKKTLSILLKETRGPDSTIKSYKYDTSFYKVPVADMVLNTLITEPAFQEMTWSDLFKTEYVDDLLEQLKIYKLKEAPEIISIDEVLQLPLYGVVKNERYSS